MIIDDKLKNDLSNLQRKEGIDYLFDLKNKKEIILLFEDEDRRKKVLETTYYEEIEYITITGLVLPYYEKRSNIKLISHQ